MRRTLGARLAAAMAGWAANARRRGMANRGIAVLLAVTAVTVLGASAMAGADAATARAHHPAGDPPSIYVTNRSTDGSGAYNVSVVDPSTGVITAQIKVEGGPEGIAVTPDGSKVYVANNFSNTVSVIDTATDTVIATVPVGSGPTGVAVSPDGSKVYVTNAYSSTVSVISTATDTVTGTISVGDAPQVVTFSPDGATAYVANRDSTTVSVIDARNNTLSTTITLPSAGGTPFGLAVTPDGSMLYVTRSADTVNVYDTATNALIKTITVGSTPKGVVVSPDGLTAYVANSGSASVSVIDTATNTVTKTISVGGTPIGIAMSPDGSAVYVVNNGGHSLSVIDAATNSVTKTIPGFFSPYWVTSAPSQAEAPKADVRITKTAPETVLGGGVITYTLKAVNDGPGEANDVTVTDDLNPELANITVPAGCGLAGHTVTCVAGVMAPGAGHEFTITARVPFHALDGSEIENCGFVSSSTPQVSEVDKDSCVTTTVVPDPADIAITKSGPATELPGGTVTYMITVTNHGPDHADDTIATDTLPAELADIAPPGGCTLDVPTRVLTCGIGTLASGATRTFTVTGTVRTSTAQGTTIDNCATVTAITPDPDLSNDYSCIQTTVGTAVPPATDVAMSKTGPATVAQGGIVTYTLRVSNHSAVDADDTVVSDELSDEVTVTGVPAGCTLADRILTCDVGALAAHATRTFRVRVRVSASAAAGFDIKNCVTAVTTTLDSDLADNGSCSEARVTHAPDTDVAITKSGPTVAAGGEEVVYTLTVANRSSTAAHDALVGDVFPDGVTVTGVPVGCTLAGQTVTCEVGTLDADAVSTFAIAATIPHAPVGSAVQNCAAVYTTSTETDLADNASCVQTIVSLPQVPVTG